MSTKAEPGVGTSEPFSSDSPDAAPDAPRDSEPASDKAQNKARLERAQENYRKANILEQLAKWEAEEKAAEAPKENAS